MSGLKKNSKNLKKPWVSFKILRDYESLRSYVLEATYDFNRPMGLDLFLKKGFLMWTKAQQQSRILIKPIKAMAEKKPKVLSEGFEQEIILVLANIILEQGGSQCISAGKQN